MTSAHRSDDVRIFQKECVSLARAGYEVFLAAPGACGYRQGVQIAGVGEQPKSRFGRMTHTTRMIYLEALALDCDIYHFHDPELLPWGLKLKRRGKTVIFDSHEDVPEQIKGKTYLPAAVRTVVARLYARYQSYAIRRFDAVISVTPHVCEKLKAHSRRTVMITNYPIPAEEEGDAEPEAEPRTVCFAGGVTALWNHEQILRALERVPGVTYRLYGAASAGYLDVLGRLPGWKQVRYAGKIPHREVQAALRCACAGMSLCSYSANSAWKTGTLGNTKLFEYMLAGIPVICTDFDLWREIVETENCGICVDPQDPGAIADAIRYLTDHPETAWEMGRNGRRAVLERYNWGTEEAKLYKLYAELSGENGTRYAPAERSRV